MRQDQVGRKVVLDTKLLERVGHLLVERFGGPGSWRLFLKLLDLPGRKYRHTPLVSQEQGERLGVGLDGVGDCVMNSATN